MSATLPEIEQVVLGSFRLERYLGAGAYAVAYLAEQLGTDRRAVVKLPHPHLLEGPKGPEIRRRFETEARAATRVSHPNVITVYTVGETDQGIPAMAMEYVDGESLATRLETQAPLPLIQIGALGTQLGEALLALHEFGIVHRDLSPANVILLDRGSKMFAKLLDFGLAHLLDAPRHNFAPMGTPGYVAPEQLRGQLSPRSDVYSLGAILWWALTGRQRSRAPTADEAPTPDSEVDAEIGPNPLELQPDAPHGLSGVVSRMLIPAHDQRLSVEAFLHEWHVALDATAIPQTYRLGGSGSDTVSHASGVVIQPTIAIVVGSGMLRTLMTSYLRSLAQVELCTIRELIQSPTSEYSAVVIDAAHPAIDVREFLQNLGQQHPGLTRIVVGSAEYGDEQWTAYGADHFVALPHELEQLGDAVSDALGRTRHSNAAASGRFFLPPLYQLRNKDRLHAALDAFIGAMPQWLAEIQLALNKLEPARALSPCAQLLEQAENLGLREISRLARAAGAFVETNDIDSATPFASALERAYHEVFPELMAQLQASEPESPA